MLPMAALLQIGTSVGQTFGVSVFNPFIEEELDLTRSQLTGCYLLASLAAAVPMPFLGWLSDRYGLRRITFGIVIVLGFGCWLISQAHNVIVLTLGFLMLRAFGQGGLTLMASNTLAMWFSRRLGFVSGLSGLGMSASFAAIPILYLLLIQQLGWREAYIALGVITWVVLLPLVILVYRNRPEDVGQGIDGLAVPPLTTGHKHNVVEGIAGEHSYDLKGAWRTRAYWIAAGLVAMWGMIGTGIFFNIVSYYETKGFTKEEAALTFTTVAMFMAALQFFGGTLADYCPLNIILCVSAAGLTTGVIVLLKMDSLWMGHLYAGLFGTSQGLLIAANNTIWAKYYGREHLGKIRSSVWTATVAGCALGPFIMGFSYDYLGGYQPSLILFIGLLALGTVAALFVTPPRRSPLGTTSQKGSGIKI